MALDTVLIYAFCLVVLVAPALLDWLHDVAVNVVFGMLYVAFGVLFLVFGVGFGLWMWAVVGIIVAVAELRHATWKAA